MNLTWRRVYKLLTMGGKLSTILGGYEQTICHVDNFMNISLVYTWGFCIFV